MTRFHVAALSAAAALILASPPAEAGVDEEPPRFTATLASVTRFVRVRETPGAAFVQGSAGREIPEGGQVFTLEAARCELRFGPGHLVRLDENSTITIARLPRPRLARTLVQLLRGRLQAIVDRAVGEGDFGVYGSTVLTAVKGTRFDVIRGEGGRVTVAVREGRVWFAQIDGEDPGEVEETFRKLVLGVIGGSLVEGSMITGVPGRPLPAPVPIPDTLPNPFKTPGGDGGRGPGFPKAPGLPGFGGIGF